MGFLGASRKKNTYRLESFSPAGTGAAKLLRKGSLKKRAGSVGSWDSEMKGE